MRMFKLSIKLFQKKHLLWKEIQEKTLYFISRLVNLSLEWR